MRNDRALCAAALILVSAAVFAEDRRRFEWTTQSAEAKSLLAELQTRIENFQVGQGNVDLAKKIVAADPKFVMGPVATRPAGSAELFQWHRACFPTGRQLERLVCNAALPPPRC